MYDCHIKAYQRHLKVQDILARSQLDDIDHLLERDLLVEHRLIMKFRFTVARARLFLLHTRERLDLEIEYLPDRLRALMHGEWW